MKKATFDPRIILAITASFLLLGGIMVFSAYYNHYYAKVSLQIKHASLLMKNVEELLLETQQLVTDYAAGTETTQAAITANHRYELKKLQAIRQDLILFRQENAEFPILSQKIDSVIILADKIIAPITEWQSGLQKSYPLFKQELNNSETFLPALKHLVNNTEQLGRIHMRMHEAEQLKSIARVNWVNYIITGISLIIMFIIFGFLQTEFDKRKAAEEELALYNRDLEKQIDAKTAELASMFERITDGFVSLDNHWNYTYINNQAAKMLGRSAASLLGKNIWKEFPEGVSTTFQEVYFRAMRNREYIHHIEYFEPWNIWFENHLYPTPNGISVFFRDITARKTAEKKLAESEFKYRYLFQKVPMAILVIDTNTRTIRAANDAAIALYGYTEEEFLALNSSDLRPDEEKARFANLSFEPSSGAPYHDQWNHRKKDGTVFPVEITAYNIVYNQISARLVLINDISERQRTAHRLEESEAKYRYLFENNPMPLLIVNAERNKFVNVNQSALNHYGYTREEFLALSPLDIRPESERKRYIEQQLNTDDKSETEGIWKHQKKDGTLIEVEITAHPIEYENNNCWLILISDVTEKQQFLEQLQQSYADIRRLNAHQQAIREEERAHIAREIHDELGQQLTGIKIDTNRLKKSIPDNDTATHEQLQKILSYLDETVKTVRRISSDLQPGVLDELGLVAALEWQCSEFEKRTGTSCRFQSQVNELPLSKSTATGIFRVYQETLTNITRHAKATQVFTQLKQNSKEIILTTHDNGVGFTMPEAKNKKTLGLINMKERAQILGGQLQIETEKGKGTTIILTVPLQTKQP